MDVGLRRILDAVWIDGVITVLDMPKLPVVFQVNITVFDISFEDQIKNVPINSV